MLHRVLATAVILAASGCAMPPKPTIPKWARLPNWATLIPNDWVADYDTAEQRMRESSGGMIIFYESGNRKADEAMFAELKSDPAADACKDLVRCTLFRTYEPDRRYVAQYGVDRAPALILLHPDGTYHHRPGPAKADEIVAFIKSSTPPGASPKINPYIPRDIRYTWINSLTEAEEISHGTEEPIFIVLDRPYTKDWTKIQEMMAHREVYDRVANMIHCRPWSWLGNQNQIINRFNLSNLPAIVILQPDGSHDELELPTSYQAIAHFLDRTKNGEGNGGVSENLNAAQGAR